MTLIVSVSELRNNISNYLEKVAQGNRVIVRDEKRAITLAEIMHTTSFDKEGYEKALRKAAGIFSEENHPEWRSRDSIIDWVTKNRKADQRNY